VLRVADYLPGHFSVLFFLCILAVSSLMSQLVLNIMSVQRLVGICLILNYSLYQKQDNAG
jgi:hypothetical protein